MSLIQPVVGAVLRGFLRLRPSLLRRIVGPALRTPEGYELDLQTQALRRAFSASAAAR